jgi:cation transport ATPase
MGDHAFRPTKDQDPQALGLHRRAFAGLGTVVAIDASDIKLMRGDPEGVALAIALSRQIVRTIQRNLFWAFAYNVLLIPVAAHVLDPIFSQASVPGPLVPLFGYDGFLNPILAPWRWPSAP